MGFHDSPKGLTFAAADAVPRSISFTSLWYFLACRRVPILHGVYPASLSQCRTGRSIRFSRAFAMMVRVSQHHQTIHSRRSPSRFVHAVFDDSVWEVGIDDFHHSNQNSFAQPVDGSTLNASRSASHFRVTKKPRSTVPLPVRVACRATISPPSQNDWPATLPIVI